MASSNKMNFECHLPGILGIGTHLYWKIEKLAFSEMAANIDSSFCPNLTDFSAIVPPKRLLFRCSNMRLKWPQVSGIQSSFLFHNWHFKWCVNPKITLTRSWKSWEILLIFCMFLKILVNFGRLEDRKSDPRPTPICCVYIFLFAIKWENILSRI